MRWHELRGGGRLASHKGGVGSEVAIPPAHPARACAGVASIAAAAAAGGAVTVAAVTAGAPGGGVARRDYQRREVLSAWDTPVGGG